MVAHQNQLNHQIQEILEVLQNQANHQMVEQLPNHHIVLVMKIIVCPVEIWEDGLIAGKK